jgi:hypothetical protein
MKKLSPNPPIFTLDLYFFTLTIVFLIWALTHVSGVSITFRICTFCCFALFSYVNYGRHFVEFTYNENILIAYNPFLPYIHEEIQMKHIHKVERVYHNNAGFYLVIHSRILKPMKFGVSNIPEEDLVEFIEEINAMVKK